MSYPSPQHPDPPKCKYCHTRDRYFQAALNDWLPYCDRDCARRACELYTTNPAVLCETCRKNPKFVDYETNTIDPFCSDACEQAMQYNEVPNEGAAVWTNTTPHSAYSQPSSVHSSTPAVNNAHSTIYFYNKHEPYYFLTNFSPHSVEWKGRVYQTAEHLFQAFKFIHKHPNIAEEIRLCQSPREALAKARQYQDYVRNDWFEGMNIQTMNFVLKLKFRQHKDLWRKLLATSGNTLIENAGSKDKFWGNGADGQGENWLGRLLMELRDQHTTKL